jgi:hypothetical protein
MPRKYLTTVLAALLVAGAACKKEAPEPESTAAPSDHVAPSPVGTSQTVLEKTFKLKGSAVFPLEIPAHAAQPHLHGIFASFTGQVHGESDDSANIDFLILSEEQHDAFAGGHASDALFSVDASHNQAVNFDLPPSMNQSVKYYLVFRNPEGSKGSKTVEASFRVDF